MIKSSASSVVVPLSPKEAWHEMLDVDHHGRPKSHTLNVQTILRQHPEVSGCFALNQLSQSIEVLRLPPWKQTFSPVDDTDFTHFVAFLNGLGLAPSRDTVIKSLEAVAAEVKFHPVKDYLMGLTWDGKGRLTGELLRYLSLTPNPYEKAVIKRFMISAVARAFEPGCKVDTMLILEGAQGVGKSTVLSVLASEAWFLDNLTDIGSGKAAQEQLRGKWLIEIAELDAMSKAEATKTKSFLSTRHDNYRVPYARITQDFPRSCVFAGTTNESTYLADSTGARRFWPVRVNGAIDLENLAAARDQLWAEATTLYQAAEQWHLTDYEVQLASEQQALRLARDPWDDALAEALRLRPFDVDAPKLIAQQELYEMLNIPAERRHVGHAKRLTRSMTSLGWENVGERRLPMFIGGQRKSVKATCYQKRETFE